MNQLLEKFNDYKSIVNYRMIYEFENGELLDFKFKQTDFPHLIGLHKLRDIPVIRRFNDRNNPTISAKYILSRIKKEELLTDTLIRNSSYFQDIEKRYEQFCKENILSISYTDAIIDFDATKIASTLQADYILCEKKELGYNHLCIAKDDSDKKYVESFFYNPTDIYIRNQTMVKVKNVKIYDNKDKLYMEDNFS